MTQLSDPDAEWIDHGRGGGCPVHGNTHVIVRFRDGIIGQGPASLWWSTDAGRSLWIHRNRPNDIVAYWIVDHELRAQAIKAKGDVPTLQP